MAVLVLVSVSGCEGQQEVEGIIELKSPLDNVIIIEPDGESKNIRFTSSLDWTADVSAGDEWLTVSPESGNAGTSMVKIKANANMTQEKRTASLNIHSGTNTLTLTVEQDMFLPTFELVKAQKEISAAGGSFRVDVRADVDYEYEISADWISDNSSKAVSTWEHYFHAEPNPLAEMRSADIVFKTGEESLVYTVTQRPAGTEQDDWKYEDFARRSLAMRFTADWCGYCPYMAQAFETARSRMSGRLEVVSLHGDGGLEMTGVTALANKYKVSGYPSGIVDGRASIPNYSNTSVTAQAAVDVAEELHAFRTPYVGIEVNSSTVTSKIEAEITLYVKEAASYKLTVLLLEDDIIAYQNGVSNANSYEHDHVARLALTSITGDTVSIDEDYTIWNGTFTGTIPSKCKKDNLRLLVYVNKPFGDDALPANVAEAEYGDFTGTYIDNCVSVKVGKEYKLQFVE